MGVKFVIPNIVYRQSFRLNSSLIQLTSIASVPSREVIYQQFPSFLDSVITQVYVWTALIRDSFHTTYIMQNTRQTLSYIGPFSDRLQEKNHMAQHLQFAYVINVSQCLFSQKEIMHSLRHFYIVCRQHVLRQVLLKKHFFE